MILDQYSLTLAANMYQQQKESLRVLEAFARIIYLGSIFLRALTSKLRRTLYRTITVR